MLLFLVVISHAVGVNIHFYFFPRMFFPAQSYTWVLQQKPLLHSFLVLCLSASQSKSSFFPSCSYPRKQPLIGRVASSELCLVSFSPCGSPSCCVESTQQWTALVPQQDLTHPNSCWSPEPSPASPSGEMFLR